MLVDVHFNIFDEDLDTSREAERVLQTIGESRRKRLAEASIQQLNKDKDDEIDQWIAKEVVSVVIKQVSPWNEACQRVGSRLGRQTLLQACAFYHRTLHRGDVKTAFLPSGKEAECLWAAIGTAKLVDMISQPVCAHMISASS